MVLAFAKNLRVGGRCVRRQCPGPCFAAKSRDAMRGYCFGLWRGLSVLSSKAKDWRDWGRGA
eukprot:12302237-Prorocentrum_lima.AAC.1